MNNKRRTANAAAKNKHGLYCSVLEQHWEQYGHHDLTSHGSFAVVGGVAAVVIVISIVSVVVLVPVIVSAIVMVIVIVILIVVFLSTADLEIAVTGKCMALPSPRQSHILP